MKPLAGRHIFLSASFPSGERAREVQPFDASAIADAVTAIVRAVLLCGGKLLFGGHPTITPLVLLIGTELKSRNAVDIFQSRWFGEQISPETWMLVESKVGMIHWTPRRPSLDESLADMRQRMLRFVQPAGAVFVGGMSGIWEEYHLVDRIRPGTPRIPVAGPGGAAAELPGRGDAVPRTLWPHIRSRHYPFVASLIVDALGESKPLRGEPI